MHTSPCHATTQHHTIAAFDEGQAHGLRGCCPNWDPVPGVIKQPSCFCLCNDRQPLEANNIPSPRRLHQNTPGPIFRCPRPAPAAQRLAASSRHRFKPQGCLVAAIRPHRGRPWALPSRGSNPGQQSEHRELRRPRGLNSVNRTHLPAN